MLGDFSPYLAETSERFEPHFLLGRAVPIWSIRWRLIRDLARVGRALLRMDTHL
jgi:hypothetical protein